MKKFKISDEEFEKHKEYYNNNFDKYDNDVYNDVKTRLVHLKNFSEKKNWFNKRYNLLFKKYQSFDSIVEIGFGLPYLPLKIKNITSKNLVYADKYDSAIEVSKEILKSLGLNADFIKGNAEDYTLWSNIEKKCKGNVLLVGIEAVEHLNSPDSFWRNAKSINPSKLIISLPIGPKIPSHNLYFKNIKEALEYLGRYMIIEEREIIKLSGKSKRNIDQYKNLIVFGRLK